MEPSFIGLLLLLAGFIIGLGAVTVIDIHGALGQRSAYWTEATIRTHKVTKPLIWIGIALASLGGAIFYQGHFDASIPRLLGMIAVLLVVNGFFLSGRVSPFLLQREREGRATEPLPPVWQRSILASLLVSDVGWWSALVLVVWDLSAHLRF